MLGMTKTNVKMQCSIVQTTGIHNYCINGLSLPRAHDDDKGMSRKEWWSEACLAMNDAEENP